MDKPSHSPNKIVKQDKPTSLATPISEEEQKRIILAVYLEKFALIAGRQVLPQLQELYFIALSDLPMSRMKAGLEGWLREGDRWPWPSDIRGAAEL